VKDGLKQLLRSNPSESQLLAVWDALAINNDREGLALVTGEARRLFPENFTFEQRRLQSYLVDLVHSDSQTGD
jgi:hypothetical protein